MSAQAQAVRSEAPPAAPIVIDLGKQRRKRVRQLRRGNGRLMEDVAAAIAELRASGSIDAAAQPIVIVVRQKRGKRRPWGL